MQASGASRSYKCSEIEKKREREKKEREKKRDHAAPSRYAIDSSHTRPILYVLMNEGTVDSPDLGGGHGVGRWPAHAR